mmetsp:Transcript_14787/g.2460  ORF Transcript_14787/g.2460 Transcript_14787/m.2460 type:complete len:123 (-) Transcript_14787:865-1233(-)
MIRDTNRVNLKFEKFSKQCSELYPNLFVGSDLIARNLQELQANGITHIINCAGNVCANYFPNDLTYLPLFLKDAAFESIDSVFYQCVEYIENAIQNGGKVFVHCMQGVSRSVTICLCYILYK